jgi:class 3 adenylate cyclase
MRAEEAHKNPWGLRFGANIHLGTVAEGEIGPEVDRRYDVFGAEVNHLFRLGGGAGIRLTEPVYRRLPNDARGLWEKHKPPAVYSMG